MAALEDYKKKRKFDKTPEPSGEVKPEGGFTYAIQKHKASTLHYDLRLEMEGVLKSWSIPKGPSTDPSQKKLAIPTEDHPLDYADFEGKIPEGQYGAGTVIVWDKGTYRSLKEDVSPKQALDQGKLEIFIEGQKLKGAYVLIKTGRKGEFEKRWLFIKMKDEHADARRNPVSTEPGSVISGKTVEDLAKEMDGG